MPHLEKKNLFAHLLFLPSFSFFHFALLFGGFFFFLFFFVHHRSKVINELNFNKNQPTNNYAKAKQNLLNLAWWPQRRSKSSGLLPPKRLVFLFIPQNETQSGR